MSELEEKDLQSQDVPQDVDAYVHYYGLTGEPFNPKKPLFFASPQLEKLLRLFNYLARFSRKLVVVTGDNGAGKTALLEKFINGQDDQGLVCFFTALNADTPKQVLYEIASQLSMKIDAENESLEQLTRDIRDYSLQRLEQGKNCIVVIDDAHLFEKPVLQQLYQLTIDTAGYRSAISLLLGGQQALIERVQAAVPSEEESKALFHQQITPLSYEEMVQYLRLYFKENSGQSKPPFSGADYQMLYQQSEGFPGRVNEQAKEVLVSAVSRLVGGADDHKGSKVFVVLVAVILLAVSGVFWWQSNHQVDTGEAATPLEITGKIERLEAVAEESESDFVDAHIVAESGRQIATPVALGAVTTGDTLELRSRSEGESIQINFAQESASDALAQEGEILAQKRVEADSVEVIESSEERVARVVASVKAVSSVLPVTEEKRETDVPATAELAPINTGSTPAAEASSPLALSIDSILALPPTEYTLQLLGSRKEESILASKAKIADDGNMLHFEKPHKGAPWYVLIYGHYADRATANAAAAKLSAELKGIKPWVRKVSDIQATINANQ